MLLDPLRVGSGAGVVVRLPSWISAADAGESASDCRNMFRQWEKTDPFPMRKS